MSGEYSVTVTWTVTYNPEEVRDDLVLELGRMPTMDEITDRIKETVIANEFSNRNEGDIETHFGWEDITIEWEGDTLDWGSSEHTVIDDENTEEDK